MEAERDYDPENRPAFVSVNCISKNGNTGDDFDTKKNKRSNDYDSPVPQPAQKMARSTVTQTKRGIVMTHDASTQTVGKDLINVHTQVSADTVNAETSPIQPSSACSPTVGTIDTDISLSVRRALDFEEELPFDHDPAVSGGFLEFLNAPLIKEHERWPAPSDVTLQMLTDTVGIQSQMLTEMKVQLSQLTQQLQASQLTFPKGHHQETVTRPQLVPGAELATESTERPRYSESVDAEIMNEMRSEVIEDGSYQYLSNETIMRLHASSRSDRNFAASMARELFSDAERLRPNVCVSGWGRSQTLSPEGKRIRFIYETVNRHFYIEPEHRRGRETLLRKAIDEANRRDLRDRQRRNSMD